jgi:hypothetical protein
MTTKEIVQAQQRAIIESNWNSIDVVIDNVNISGQQVTTKQSRVLDMFGEGDSYEFSLVIAACHIPRIANNKKLLFEGVQYKIVYFENNGYSITLHLSK